MVLLSGRWAVLMKWRLATLLAAFGLFLLPGMGVAKKKRPPIRPARMQSRSGKSEGRGAAITRKHVVGYIHCKWDFSYRRDTLQPHLLDRL
jgi:hypothetical protein